MINKKGIYFIFIILIVLIVGSSFITSQEASLPFNPDCIYEGVPTFNNWLESFDGSDLQNYCLYSTSPQTLFISQQVLTNFAGQPFTATNPDIWRLTFISEKGNIRQVNISFEYYVPLWNGQCIPQSINAATGFYNSPQSILITNADSNLSAEGTFEDAFIQFNNQIVCDSWRNFTVKVLEFTNDFGSSFSGQSKDIGSIGFEAKNIYIRNIRLINSTAIVNVW